MTRCARYKSHLRAQIQKIVRAKGHAQCAAHAYHPSATQAEVRKAHSDRISDTIDNSLDVIEYFTTNNFPTFASRFHPSKATGEASATNVTELHARLADARLGSAMAFMA